MRGGAITEFKENRERREIHEMGIETLAISATFARPKGVSRFSWLKGFQKWNPRLACRVLASKALSTLLTT